MELCCDMVISMPSNYVEIDNDEMVYLEGGLSITQNSAGYKITLSARNCGDLAALAAGGSISVASVAALLGLSGVGIPWAIAGVIYAGVLGVGSSYMWICSNHNGATMQALFAGNAFLGFTPPIIKW
ncbi:MAG: hypothetical protein CVU84_07430 [Firmicutes bacterium HGW-Firmicutes-1]|jgi:hypothetical protein|nr:MAG: hypothetical protein CVU84_07430 [Firmicutes bacterium HGW-Firmicutes-1]